MFRLITILTLLGSVLSAPAPAPVYAPLVYPHVAPAVYPAPLYHPPVVRYAAHPPVAVSHVSTLLSPPVSPVLPAYRTVLPSPYLL